MSSARRYITAPRPPELNSVDQRRALRSQVDAKSFLIVASTASTNCRAIQTRRILRQKLGALHEGIRQGQLSCGQVRATDYARPVAGKHRIARQLLRFRLIRVVRIRERLIVAKRRAVKPEDIRARLLILQLKEESVRDIEPFVVNASLVCPALGDLADPEIKAALVRQAAEKVVEMLAHKEPLISVVERVGRG